MMNGESRMSNGEFRQQDIQCRALYSLFAIRYCLGAVLVIMTIFTPGCRAPQTPEPQKNYFYINPIKKPNSVGRVVLVELQNESSYPQISMDIAEALFQAMQKKQVFGLTVIAQNEPSWRSLQFREESTLDLNQMVTIRDTLQCDGLLVGTISEFRPYPHMAIGLRLKLLDLADGQLLWALEQIWDSTDKMTHDRIANYFKSVKGSGLAPLHEQLTTVSPLEFIKFVSYEVAETIG